MSLLKNTARALVPGPLRKALRGLLQPPAQPLDRSFQYPFAGLSLQGSGQRQNYRWGTLCAASLAKNLGYERISVIEFGVAGGNGLIALENSAADIEALSGVKIDVYGFDTAQGLPKPVDHRDLPQMWSEGHYGMDEGALRRKLKRAELIIGPVSKTVPEFIRRKPAPIGFVSFDMDLYSSTMDAFELFSGHSDLILPRVTCYFDDIFGYSHGDFSGERLAMTDFNLAHAHRKVSKLYGLRYLVQVELKWAEMMYMLHAFDHPKYLERDGTVSFTEMPLRP